MLFETLSFCEPLNQFVLVSQRNMPGVRLRSSRWPAWLGEEPADEPHLQALLAPYPSDEMVCWPVSAARRQRQEQ